MAFFYAARVRDTSVDTGSGPWALAGAPDTTYKAISASGMADGDISDFTLRKGSDWESIVGQYNAGSGTLSVLEFKESSTGSLVSFGSGTLDIIMEISASRAAQLLRDGYDYLVNGTGQVNQAVAGSGIADNTYGHDQWVALTQTGAIAVSTLTDVEDGLSNMIRLTQSQSTAQRVGYLQPLETSRVKRLRGKTVSLVMRLRNSTGGAIRYALVEHTGTADTLTRDIVNDWTSSNYTTGNFFTAQSGDITVRAVGTITPSANTLTDALLTATLGSSFNNLYVFIWTEATAAQNATLDMACNLRRGYASHPVIARPLSAELQECERYYEKSYELATAPGTAGFSAGAVDMSIGTATTVSLFQHVQFRTRKRLSSALSVVLYDDAGTAGCVYKGASGATAVVNQKGESGFNGGTANTTSSAELFFHWVAANRL